VKLAGVAGILADANEPKDEAERKWRSGFKLKSTSPAPFPPAYPGRSLAAF
jgi:hypothetical protein